MKNDWSKPSIYLIRNNMMVGDFHFLSLNLLFDKLLEDSINIFFESFG